MGVDAAGGGVRLRFSKRTRKLGVDAGEGLTQEEMVTAENALFRMTQWQAYEAEIVLLQRRQHGQRVALQKQSKLYQLTPYLDENSVLRIGSRVGTARNVSMV